jgi:fructokinase
MVPAVRVPVVDTVGAGDAFSAGLLAGLAQHGVTSRAALDALYIDDLVATLRFAAAVAALTCARAGADPPRRAEVRAFLAEHTEHLPTEAL